MAETMVQSSSSERSCRGKCDSIAGGVTESEFRLVLALLPDNGRSFSLRYSFSCSTVQELRAAREVDTNGDAIALVVQVTVDPVDP
jgi:hypothetical protein